MSKELKRETALFTVCLSNEPVYDRSGRNPESRGEFTAWLKKLHGQIEALNDLYGTTYQSFEQAAVPAIGLKATVPENRAYYDWVRFNQQHFADWHGWMRSMVKQNLPTTPTHAKIMVFWCLDRDRLHYGVDPELFCEATDLAGCDAYAFPQGDQAYDWRGQEFFYDVLYSFRHQPVFNSENHVIPDGAAPCHIPMAITRAQFWQGGLHHQAVTTTWVWEEPWDPSLAGSIYLRPANAYGAGRAMLDLNRCAREVAAINQAAPRVALLYSPPSIFWEPAYKGTIQSLYSQLNFLGEPVTFVSEKQLAEGKAPKVQWIVLPQATHMAGETVKGLQRFARSGGHLVLVNEHNLEWDQYHRPRASLGDFANASTLTPEANESETASRLHDLLSEGGLNLADLADTATGKRAWGVEFRIARAEGKPLVSLINLTPKVCEVRVPGLSAGRATDLLSGETVAADRVRLEPMAPRLLSATP